MSQRQRLLFIGPLPEPTTGHSLACKVLLDELVKDYDVEVVDLNKESFLEGVDSFIRIGEVLHNIAQAAYAQHRADLIYFTPSESFAGNLKDLLIYLFCWRKLGRMVIHLHGGASMRALMQGKYPLLPPLNRAALRHLRGAIVLGPRLVDIYADILPPEKIHVAANFAQDEFFSTDAEIREKFATPSPLKLLFLSNLLPGKGHIELATAFKSLSPTVRADFSLGIAGGFDTPAREAAFKALIADVPEITYHGTVRGELKRRLLKEAHVFLLPTYYAHEGQPISILEAYASGAAVVTTNHSGIFDVFDPGVNGYVVEKGSADDLAGLIARLRGDDRLLAMGLANATRARAEFRVSDFTARIRRAIEAPVARSQPTAETTPAKLSVRPYQMCRNCIMDTTDANIRFDAQGRCDYCNNYYANILPHWHTDERGERQLATLVDRIKAEGRGKSHDCLIGLSGGVDSSYLTYIAVEKYGLRPLLYHVDAGWNSQEAVNNIEKLVDGLGLDLFTEVIDWPEMRDLQLAFFKARVPHLDTPQDHAFFAGLYNFAARNKVKYILTGANYSTECVREPLAWHYHASDLRHLKDIHRRFGTRPLRKFPTADIATYRLYYRYVKGVRVVKPLNYIPYLKEAAMDELVARFGWQKYAHKHHESRFTRFYEGYWLPKKFGFDKRRAHFSSLILTGQMTREIALATIAQPAIDRQTAAQDFEYVANKLGVGMDELQALMDGPDKTYRDYKNNMFFFQVGTAVLRLAGEQRAIIR